MTAEKQGSLERDDWDPSLLDFLKSIWEARLEILTGVILCTVITTGFILAAPQYYTAEVIVAPPYDPLQVISSEQVPHNAGKDNAYGAVFNRRDALYSNYATFQNGLRGNTIAEILAKDPDIFNGIEQAIWPKLLPYDYTGKEGDFVRSHLEKAVKITVVPNTDLRRITYAHPDPGTALRFLETIIGATDQIIKDRDYAMLKSRKEFLEDSLAKTVDPQRRQSLAFLMTLVEQKRLTMQLDESYSIRIIEPPFTRAKPSWPSKSLFFATAVLVGVICGYGFHILRNA